MTERLMDYEPSLIFPPFVETVIDRYKKPQNFSLYIKMAEPAEIYPERGRFAAMLDRSGR